MKGLNMIKPYRTIILVAIALLLFVPTGILVARAHAAGDFPRYEEVDRIEYVSGRGDRTALDKDGDHADALFWLFEHSEKIRRSEVPAKKECDAYRFDFTSGKMTETLYLSIDKRDFSCYIQTSTNRFFSFRIPTLSIRSATLVPARISWYYDGEEEPSLIYPIPDSSGVLGIKGNQLSDWSYLADVTSESAFSSKYRVFNEKYELIGETETPEEAIALCPAHVLLSVGRTVADGARLEIGYYFYVSENY
jgi:hypothetical protein